MKAKDLVTDLELGVKWVVKEVKKGVAYLEAEVNGVTHTATVNIANTVPTGDSTHESVSVNAADPDAVEAAVKADATAADKTGLQRRRHETSEANSTASTGIEGSKADDTSTSSVPNAATDPTAVAKAQDAQSPHSPDNGDGVASPALKNRQDS